jgi:hypothetical protein
MGTLPEWWTGPYPEVSSVESATDYLDGLGAALNRREEDGDWTLLTGKQELITAATADELDSFVLGFALAHLICERHGPIGQPSGPVSVPHPADVEDAGPAPLEQDEDEGDAEGAGSGEGGEGGESADSEDSADSAESAQAEEADDESDDEDQDDSERQEDRDSEERQSD